MPMKQRWTYLNLIAMISHQTLYALANSLGILAMVTVIGYHFVTVNARQLSGNAKP